MCEGSHVAGSLIDGARGGGRLAPGRVTRSRPSPPFRNGSSRNIARWDRWTWRLRGSGVRLVPDVLSAGASASSPTGPCPAKPRRGEEPHAGAVRRHPRRGDAPGLRWRRTPWARRPSPSRPRCSTSHAARTGPCPGTRTRRCLSSAGATRRAGVRSPRRRASSTPTRPRGRWNGWWPCGPPRRVRSDNGPLRVIPGSHRRGLLGATAVDEAVRLGRRSNATFRVTASCSCDRLLLSFLSEGPLGPAPKSRRVSTSSTPSDLVLARPVEVGGTCAPPSDLRGAKCITRMAPRPSEHGRPEPVRRDLPRLDELSERRAGGAILLGARPPDVPSVLPGWSRVALTKEWVDEGRLRWCW